MSATRITLGCGCQTVTSSYGERPSVGQTFECRPHGWVHITATTPEMSTARRSTPTTPTTPALRRLVADAEAAGYEVVNDIGGYHIAKYHPSGRVRDGVYVLTAADHGTGAFVNAYRTDIPNSTWIPTIKAVRAALGLR